MVLWVGSRSIEFESRKVSWEHTIGKKKQKKTKQKNPKTKEDPWCHFEEWVIEAKRKQDLMKVMGTWTTGSEAGVAGGEGEEDMKRRGIWGAEFIRGQKTTSSKESRGELAGLSLAHPIPGWVAVWNRLQTQRKRLERGPEARWQGVPLGHPKTFLLPRMPRGDSS